MAHGNPYDEAEHAAHRAQDPFDRRVAMSMVVIAAILAMVKVMGHRTHNDTLGYQIESGNYNTQASNLWQFFQAKKVREVLARQDAKNVLLFVIPSKDGPALAPRPLPDRDKRLEKVTKNLTDEEVKEPGKEAKVILDKAEQHYKELLEKRYPVEQVNRIINAEIDADRYDTEGTAIVDRARKLTAKATEFRDKSERKHHQAFYFDLGELGVELALVLSSVAILTKRPNYWYAGLILSVAGLVAVVLGFLAH